MKKVLKIVLVTILTAFVGLIIATLIYLNPPLDKVMTGVKPGLTSEKIKEVQLRMTPDDVIQILGEPFNIVEGRNDSGSDTWFYSKVIKTSWRIKVWIDIEENKVSRVRVTKRGFFGPEGFIYTLCDLGTHEEPEFEKYFNHALPQT